MEVDRYKPTRASPGTIRDPLNAACTQDDDSDESCSDDDHEHPAGEAASACAAECGTAPQNVEQLNRLLEMVPTDAEIRAVTGYKGDCDLGPPELNAELAADAAQAADVARAELEGEGLEDVFEGGHGGC